MELKNSNKVITIDKEGVISGLFSDELSPMYRDLGDHKVSRVSLIEFDTFTQKWFVRLICKFNKTGEDTPFPVTLSTAYDGTIRNDCATIVGKDHAFKIKECAILFDTYQEAVDVEVLVLNYLRAEGVYPVI